MDALRKLGSMGRNKDNKEAAESSPKADIPKEDMPSTPEKNVEEESKEESHSGLTPIRAPISDDVEGGDGDVSYGSGDSFDSALERMAASSSASFEPTSPVGSHVSSSHFDKHSRGLAPGQQGALMRLNQMLNGESSLDMTVIDNCTEDELKEKIEYIARKKELAIDDPSISSILDALLPLVREQAEAEGEDDEERIRDHQEGAAVGDEEGEHEEDDEEEDEDEEEEEEEDEDEDEEVEETAAGVSVRAMPVAKLSAEDEEQGEDDNEDEDGDEDDEHEFEEANDEGIEEEEETLPVASRGRDVAEAQPRIIARESKDDHVDDGETSLPSKDLVRELEKVASPAEERTLDASGVKELETGLAAPVAPEESGKVPVEKEEPESREDAAVKSEDSEVAAPAATEVSGEGPAEKKEKPELASEEAQLADATSISKDEAETIPPSKDLVLELEKLSISTETPDVSKTEDQESQLAAPIAPEESGKVAVEKEEEPESAAPVAPEESSRAAVVKAEAPSEDEDAYEEANEDHEVEDDEPGVPEESSMGEPTEEETSPLVVSSTVFEEPKRGEDTVAVSGAPKEANKVGSVEEKKSPSEEEELLLHESKTEEANAPTAAIVENEKASAHSNGDAKVEGPTFSVAPEQASQEVDLSANDSEPSPVESPDIVSKDVVAEKGEQESASSINSKESNFEDVAVIPSPAKMYTALKAVDADIPPLKSETSGRDGTTEEESKVTRNVTEKSVVEPHAENGDWDADEEDDEDENDDEDDDEDEEVDVDMDTAKALAELANAVGGKSDSGAGTANKPSLGAAGPSLPQRPTVRKSSATALEPAARSTNRGNGAAATQLATANEENATNGDGNDGSDETREKLQNIRVKFLRLAHRLGQSPQNVVVAQVLYRLGLAEQLRGGRTTNRAGAFSFDRANALAEEQEATGSEEELDFACTILLLGKTGVGKSATINSIFDEQKTGTNAFSPSTKKVQEIVGTVHGIKVRVIDTPGLLPSVIDQQHNERIMGSVKKYIRKSSPDIVLYFDRLDMQSRDYGDLPLLRTITDLFGAAVWFNAIVVLTHASSAPPDGPNGVPLSYEMFVAQRSHVVQQTIRQAAGDMRLMNPVSLVENHPACRTNRIGQRVLPNGQIWKPQLLLLCFASKILAEANSLLKLQDTGTPGRPFGQRPRVPPLPFLLSSLLQSRTQLKMPDEQMGDDDDSDEEIDEDDSDGDDYDELPPFRPLAKEELEELSKEQKQQYFEELADREKLFQKKQWREEIRQRKEMKKRAAAMSKEELSQPVDEGMDDEAGRAAAVPVPMPDMALPPSFDSDNPTHRYRYLETANQWLVRPVLETHGWDHDAGYDGFNVEKLFVVKDKIPASISGQVTKDKKEAQVNFEAAASFKHGEGKVTLTGFDVQTIGKDLAYTLRSETRFNNFKRNKTTAGLTFTLLGDTIAAGLKLEDRLIVGKRLKMVVNGGVLTGRGDKAFGGSLEATLRGKDYPLSRTLSTLGLSVMDWHGDLAIGGNLQSQFMVGKTMMVARGNLNNRGAGQISIRASSSEQLQMVLIGIIPILRSLINTRFGTAHPSQ